MMYNLDTSGYSKIDDFVKTGSANIFALNNVVTRENFNNQVSLPAFSIFRDKYRDIIMSNIVELSLNDEMIKKYKYNPKSLSYDLYKTTDLWYIILVLNAMTSITQFNLEKRKINVYDPNKIRDLNRIMYKEDKI